ILLGLVAVGIALLVVLGVVIDRATGASSVHSHSTAVPTAPPVPTGTAVPTGTTAPGAQASAVAAAPNPATVGKLQAHVKPLPLLVGGVKVGTITMGRGEIVSPHRVVPANGTVLVTFRVQLTAGKTQLVYNPLYFAVYKGASTYDMIVGGGRLPELDTGTLAAGHTVVGYLTTEAPVHGILVYAPGGRATSMRWAY
ncbi:MAG: hypothetical protein ACQSGP_11575, partial [Frankia sp.]